MYTPYNIFYPELPKYRNAGQAANNTNPTDSDTEDEKLKIGDVFESNGKTYRVKGYDSDGNIQAIEITDPKEIRFSQYQTSNLKPAEQKGWTIRKSKTKYSPYDTQTYDPSIGGYTYQGQPLDWADFKDRHKDLIESELGISYDEWENNAKSKDKTIREKAVGDFQRSYNKWYKEATGVDYFTGSGGNDPYGQDDKFGLYTSSAPGLSKPVGKPKMDLNKKDDPLSEIQRSSLTIPPRQRRRPRAWLQDIINLAGAGIDWASIQKILPWAKKVDLQEAKYALLDPTWQLQNNASLMNQQIQGAAALGTPQAYATNVSQFAGQGMDQSQRILSGYDEKNALIQNEGEERNTAIRNKEEMTNAEIATNLYDKTAIANQQFNNAKTLARKNIRDGLVNLYTNMAATQAQNLTSSPFQVLPETGGFVMWDPSLATEMAPSQSDAKTREQRLDYILGNENYKGQDLETVYKLLFPDENLGYSGYRQGYQQRGNRRRQAIDPNYLLGMYPGATGGMQTYDPYMYGYNPYGV
jgi:hypothetical protein